MPKRKPQMSLGAWPEVDAALARLCALDTDRQKALGQMNAELAAVRERFNDGLENLAQEDKTLRAQIEQFAREHEPEFSPQKRVERLHGVLAFRTTPPAVTPLSRRWSAAATLAALRGKFASRFIRVTEEIDKAGLLAQRAAGAVSDEQLADCGLRIAQREIFNVDLKHERAPALPSAGAPPMYRDLP